MSQTLTPELADEASLDTYAHLLEDWFATVAYLAPDERVRVRLDGFWTEAPSHTEPLTPERYARLADLATDQRTLALNGRTFTVAVSPLPDPFIVIRRQST